MVKMEYTLAVDGRVVDSSAAGGPFQFKAGAGEIVPGLEEGLMGLRPGDERTLTVSAERGYGLHDPTAIQQVSLKDFGPLAKDLKVGRAVQGLRGGKPAEGQIVALDDKSATLDFNHRLAGKTLVFKVKVLSVER
ncbi:MAG: peptidylprolyl isomerase [Elusimicrobia bacterium]|nr:peptidylprolyl isomerase [Elusimicrobiota bacterium]